MPPTADTFDMPPPPADVATVDPAPSLDDLECQIGRARHLVGTLQTRLDETERALLEAQRLCAGLRQTGLDDVP